MSDPDGSVVGDGPARVVRDFPHVAIRVGEGSRHAAPLGACRRPHDLPAGLLGLGKYYRNLFGGSNILREFDTGCAVAPERSPEPPHHATSLEEADLLVRLLCAAPAHRLIKGSGPGQIADAKGYQTDALLHWQASQSTTNCVIRCSGVRLDTQGAGPEEIVSAVRQPLVVSTVRAVIAARRLQHFDRAATSSLPCPLGVKKLECHHRMIIDDECADVTDSPLVATSPRPRAPRPIPPAPRPVGRGGCYGLGPALRYLHSPAGGRSDRLRDRAADDGRAARQGALPARADQPTHPLPLPPPHRAQLHRATGRGPCHRYLHPLGHRYRPHPHPLRPPAC